MSFDVLASGFTLVEAPRHDGAGGAWFTDVFGGGVYHVDGSRVVSTVVPKRRGAGGLVPHADGGIVVSGRDVIHVTSDGDHRVVLAAPEGVTGFNDLVTDAGGALYVGALRYRPMASEDAIPGEFWRVSSGSDASVAFGGVDWPNGVGFSPDGRTAYASDYANKRVMRYTLTNDGTWESRGVFVTAPAGSCDGLAVDQAGRVWVALADGGGVARFTSDGEAIDVVRVPATMVVTVAFGGDDGRHVLYGTGDNIDDASLGGCLIASRTDVPGVPVPAARVSS